MSTPKALKTPEALKPYSPKALKPARQLLAGRQVDRIHLRLCARLHAWQVSRGRHFHLEQPELSKMLDENALQSMRQHSEHTFRVLVDMYSFGLRTPVTKKPIRKQTVILSFSPLSEP